MGGRQSVAVSVNLDEPRVEVRRGQIVLGQKDQGKVYGQAQDVCWQTCVLPVYVFIQILPL